MQIEKNQSPTGEKGTLIYAFNLMMGILIYINYNTSLH